MNAKRKQTYESYNYKILWQAANHSLAMAEKEKNNSKYFYLSSMLMVYFAFEAYCSHLISLIAPEVWENEIEFFSRLPYQGTLGKHFFLSRTLVLPKPDISRRPFQTAKELQKLRDLAVHGKPERGSRIINVKPGQQPCPYKSKLEKASSKVKAKRAFDDIDKMMAELYEGARLHYGDMFQSDHHIGIIQAYSITDNP